MVDIAEISCTKQVIDYLTIISHLFEEQLWHDNAELCAIPVRADACHTVLGG